MEQNKPVRLTFLDIMRFIALFMMIQGHTIYAILNTEIRDGSSFHVWTLLRGYTAPFFMVIAGAVFTFLLLQQDKTKIKGNIRIKKGLLRVATCFFGVIYYIFNGKHLFLQFLRVWSITLFP